MGDAEVEDAGAAAPELKNAGSAEMVFQHVCVDANGKRILWDVSGKALPGQMLALMGPSGKSRHNVNSSSYRLTYLPRPRFASNFTRACVKRCAFS